MTSSISSLVKIWKMRHSGSGCRLRVMYFKVKYSCLYNKAIISFVDNAGKGDVFLSCGLFNRDKDI